MEYKYIVKMVDPYNDFDEQTRTYRSGNTQYIAEGKPYNVHGQKHIPLTKSKDEARRYKTRYLAERAAEQSAVNLYGWYEILRVKI